MLPVASYGLKHRPVGRLWSKSDFDFFPIKCQYRKILFVNPVRLKLYSWRVLSSLVSAKDGSKMHHYYRNSACYFPLVRIFSLSPFSGEKGHF